jgi:hypothetical protein
MALPPPTCSRTVGLKLTVRGTAWRGRRGRGWSWRRDAPRARPAAQACCCASGWAPLPCAARAARAPTWPCAPSRHARHARTPASAAKGRMFSTAGRQVRDPGQARSRGRSAITESAGAKWRGAGARGRVDGARSAAPRPGCALGAGAARASHGPRRAAPEAARAAAWPHNSILGAPHPAACRAPNTPAPPATMRPAAAAALCGLLLLAAHAAPGALAARRLAQDGGDGGNGGGPPALSLPPPPGEIAGSVLRLLLQVLRFLRGDLFNPADLDIPCEPRGGALGGASGARRAGALRGALLSFAAAAGAARAARAHRRALAGGAALRWGLLAARGAAMGGKPCPRHTFGAALLLVRNPHPPSPLPSLLPPTPPPPRASPAPGARQRGGRRQRGRLRGGDRLGLVRGGRRR